MEKILFVNACIRENSRTKRLAEHLLERLANGKHTAWNPENLDNAETCRCEIKEINLCKENIPAISSEETINRRYELVKTGHTDAPELRYAREFAQADTIVIAAPYWDLAFPALLKIYMEYVTVTGITFRYSQEGRPVGMCRARRLFYVTTAGGPAIFNLGYDYISTLCRNFYGIDDIRLFKAENLDIIGNDPEHILASAMNEIDLWAETQK